MNSLDGYTQVENQELSKIDGGKILWIAIGEEAYRHSDQIIKGFKRAHRKYR